MSDDIQVVILRLHTGEDLIGIHKGEEDDTHVLVSFPFYARYEVIQRSMVLVPYCPLTDDSDFYIAKEKIDFIASCRQSIIDKYLQVVDEFIKSEGIQGAPEISPHIIEGNKTKH